MKTLSQIIKETYSEVTDWSKDPAVQAIQSKLKKAKVSYRDPNAKTAREEDRIAKKLAAQAKMKKEEVELDEQGLWDNIRAKQERIKAGSGERMRKPGSKGAPSFKSLKDASVKEETQLDEIQVNWTHSTQKYHTIKHPDGSHYGVFDHGTYGTKGHEIRKIKDSDGNVVKAKDSRKQGDRYKSGMGSPLEAAKSWTKKYGGTILNHKLKEQAEYDEWAEMTRSELKIAINSAKEILDMMDEGIEIERWQISEIVTASDSLATVYQNLCADNDYEDNSEEDYA